MKYYNRNLQKDIDKFLFDDDIIIITGSRQCGKTSLLKYYFNALKQKNKTAFFYNLEDIDYLNILNETPKNIFKLFSFSNKKKFFIFIDEIQYLNNPTNFLKYIYDEYKENIKLFVSGSSAFYLDKKFKDSLAGRKKIFNLSTLNFSEFLLFKNEPELKKKYDKIDFINKKEVFNNIEKRKIDILLNEYLIYGGYPRVVLEKDVEKKQKIIEEIANSYVKKDAFENNINYVDKFIMLFKLLAAQIGNLVNKNELAKHLNISVTAIDNYLSVMLKSFHINLLSPFYTNVRKELRKMKKVYFMDIGLRNYFMNNFQILETRFDKGNIFENFIFRELVDKYKIDNLKFWRTKDKTEVDFILNNKIAIEVKYNLASLKLSKYKSFFNIYPEFKFIIICRKVNQDKVKNFKKTKIISI